MNRVSVVPITHTGSSINVDQSIQQNKIGSSTRTPEESTSREDRSQFSGDSHLSNGYTYEQIGRTLKKEKGKIGGEKVESKDDPKVRKRERTLKTVHKTKELNPTAIIRTRASERNHENSSIKAKPKERRSSTTKSSNPEHATIKAKNRDNQPNTKSIVPRLNIPTGSAVVELENRQVTVSLAWADPDPNPDIKLGHSPDERRLEREGKKKLAPIQQDDIPSTLIKDQKNQISAIKSSSTHASAPSNLEPINLSTEDKKNQNKPFSPSELKDLSIITHFNQAKNVGAKLKPSPQQTKLMKAIFLKATGNSAVNKQMQALIDKQDFSEIDEATVKMLLAFSYRTKEIENIPMLVQKTENIFKKIDLKQSISDSEKLGLEELGALESYSKLSPAFDFIKAMKLDKADPQLNNMSHACKKGKNTIDRINIKLQKYSNYKPGDLLFNNYSRELKFRRKNEEMGDKVKNLVLNSPLHHAAIVCTNTTIDGEKEGISHIMKEYTREDIKLSDKACTSGFRLNAAKLVKNPDIHRFLNEMYVSKGKDFNQEINERFRDVQNELHSSQRKYQNVALSKKKMIKSGIAEIFSFFRKGKKDEGRQELHQEFYGDQPLEKQKMICSEFASKALLAGLVEEENQIKAELKTYLVSKKGYPPQKVDEWLDKVGIFTLPFSDKEDLSKMTPTRLLEGLAKNGSIERLQPPPMLQQLIKASDLNIDPKEQILNAPVVSGFSADEAFKTQMVSPIVEFHNDPLPALDNPKIEDKWVNEEGFLKPLHKGEKLFSMIKERRSEIKEQKEKWRATLEKEAKTSATAKRVKHLEKRGILDGKIGGMGGAYKLCNRDGQPEYIIKPVDEDILGLNNRKNMASPELGDVEKRRVRRGIPLYTSPQTEALTYQVAEDIGLGHITPKTRLVIFTSEHFHDVTDNTQEIKANKEELLGKVGQPDREKLCSVQEFIPNSKDLQEHLNDIAKKGNDQDLSLDQKLEMISNSIDQKDVEDCLLLGCITGETDGNAGNYRLYQKGVQENGEPFYGMKKVDNALCFSEKLADFDLDVLKGFPQSQEPLSERGKQIILNVDENKLIEKMRYYGKSEEAILNFQKRILILKEVAKIPDVTLEDLASSAKLLKNIPKLRIEEYMQRNNPPAKIKANVSFNENNRPKPSGEKKLDIDSSPVITGVVKGTPGTSPVVTGVVKSTPLQSPVVTGVVNSGENEELQLTKSPRDHDAQATPVLSPRTNEINKKKMEDLENEAIILRGRFTTINK